MWELFSSCDHNEPGKWLRLLGVRMWELKTTQMRTSKAVFCFWGGFLEGPASEKAQRQAGGGRASCWKPQGGRLEAVDTREADGS